MLLFRLRQGNTGAGAGGGGGGRHFLYFASPFAALPYVCLQPQAQFLSNKVTSILSAVKIWQKLRTPGQIKVRSA